MLLKTLADLAPADFQAIIINAGTPMLAMPAPMSTLKHARMPVLLGFGYYQERPYIPITLLPSGAHDPEMEKVSATARQRLRNLYGIAMPSVQAQA